MGDAKRCTFCGEAATLRQPYRSTYPRQPICEGCAGPYRATPERDAWGEFGSYPIDARLPLQRAT